MRFSGTPGKRFNLLLALFFLITNFATPAAFADHGEPISFTVFAYTCDPDPGDVSVAAGTVPDSCTPTNGASFTIATDIGTSSGGCTIDSTGQCGAMVPHGATVTVTEDTTTLGGVVPRTNPLVSQAVTAPASVTFINLPVAVTSQETVSIQAEVPTPTATLPPPAAIPTATETAVLPVEPTATQAVVLPVEPTATMIPTSTETPPPLVTSQSRTTTLLPETSDTTAVTLSPTATATVAATPTPTPVPVQTPVTTTFGTVTNTGGMGLRCRTQPNTSATIITVLAEGTRLEARGAESSGWLPVRCGGMDGWVYTAYISISTSTTTPSPTAPTSGTTGLATVTNTGGMGLRCRNAPITSATIITVLAEGSRVETRGAVSNGWLPVRCVGVDGWVSATYATVSTSSTNPAPAPTTPPVSGTASTATVTGTGGGGLNCRNAPVSGAVITILPEGALVETRGAVSNGWLPVRCSGQDAWVSATYVTLSSSGTTPTPTPTAPSGSSSYAMVSGTGGGGLNCRTAPVSGSVITILPEGARIEVVASAQNGWAQVRCASQVGWASAAYLVFNVGSGSGSGAVWIDVNLTKQYMIVYQGSNIIGQTYVSTGRYGFDTPPGTFYVNYKLPSQTMTGVLGGEYYYVEDVPWVMYFTNRGHAIHGAYWHNNFGYRMSHGCVNLPVGFAAWLYSISPVGTRVYIHY